MLKKGDFVSVKNSTLKGKILNIKKYKNIQKHSNTENEYIVLINNKKVHISENNLIVLDNNENNMSNTNNYIDNSKKINYESSNNSNNIKINYNIGNTSNFIPEIMIRHKNVDEAIYELEDFINEAIYNNIYTVRIIHGKSRWYS